MAYATYEDYTGIYKGNKIPQADFNRLAECASDVIDNATFGRASTYDDPSNLIKKACCAVADTLLKYENGGGVASETVGRLTVNYVAGVSTAKTEEQAIAVVIRRYLAYTGLLYAGVCG